MPWHTQVRDRKIFIAYQPACPATCALDLAISAASRGAFGRGVDVDHDVHFETEPKAQEYAEGLIQHQERNGN